MLVVKIDTTGTTYSKLIKLENSLSNTEKALEAKNSDINHLMEKFDKLEKLVDGIQLLILFPCLLQFLIDFVIYYPMLSSFLFGINVDQSSI